MMDSEPFTEKQGVQNHRRHRTVVRSLISALIMILACSGALSAEQATPIISTPTPRPTATPVVMTARQALAATPEAARRGSVTFFPWAAQAADVGREVEPASFNYVVQPGDTLWSLALDFGRDLDTMACAIPAGAGDAETLVPGQLLVVPSLTDLCYTVIPGESLVAIAARFGVSLQVIVDVPGNGFNAPPYGVRAQQRVLLPGVRPEALERSEPRTISYAADVWALSPFPGWPFGDGEFIWPVSGPISQAAHPGHWALDIAVPVGTPVRAADRGTVVLAGWNNSGYGFRAVVDHGNDYVTLYAHLSDIFVEVGQVVGEGQTIGLSGANGNVTGPHLHFELRDFGRLTDPLRFLPG